jgi:PST family polysaccharide transporter
LGDPWLPSVHGEETRGLRGHVARGLTWTIVDTWGRQLLNLLVFVLLARLLTPDDFGLVALAATFILLFQLIVDQGLGDALIQKQTISPSQLNTAFWAAVATGVVLTLAGILLAAPVALVVAEPKQQAALTAVLQALSFSFLPAAGSSIQIAILRREFRFRELAMRALISTAAGGIAGVGLALYGAGAWALVAQQLVTAVVSLLVLWRASPWRPSIQASFADFRELSAFGLKVVGSDVLNFLSRNVDNLLIGVVLGFTPLGLYSVGYRVLTVTQNLLINVARRVAFPAFSRLQGDVPRMRRSYFQVTRVAGAFILPGYIGLALVAPEMTILVFGRTWTDSGPVAAVLFLIGPVLTLQAFSGAYLNAIGQPGVVLRFRFITTVTNVAGFLIAVWFGILAVAAAFVLRGYLLLPLNLSWMSRYGQIPIGEYLGRLQGVAIATAAMAAVVLLVKLLLAGHRSLSLLLAAEVIAGGATYVLVIWLVERRLVHDVLALLSEVFRRGGRRKRGGAPDAGPEPDPGLSAGLDEDI